MHNESPKPPISNPIKPRLLLIAQHDSYRIAPYLRAAERMGLKVLIASRGEYSLVSEIHQGLHVDLDNLANSLARIIKEAKKEPFAGILGSDDSTVELASNVAYKLGLPHNPPNASRISYRKDLARAQLANAGCPVPIHRLIDFEQPLDRQMSGLPWPCVIKPLNMSASRGVIRANNVAQFLGACERIKSIISTAKGSFEKTHALAEAYVDGIEVAYEGYLVNGELHTLTIFDKPDPLEGPYFEETIYVTPSRLNVSTQTKIKQRVSQACKCYGLITGPIHAEMRIDKQDIWILEVASRTIGGDCARVLDRGSDFNLEELAIALAIGKPVTTTASREATGVMMIPNKQGGILRRIEGLDKARAVHNVEKIDIIAREGHELVPLPEGNQYPGYIFARGNSSDEVILALRKAYAELNFVIAPVFKLTHA